MLRLTTSQTDDLADICYHYGLTPVYDWFGDNNPSNDLPYHNRYHAQCMMLYCHEGARVAALTSAQTKTLLLAALFHDGDHLGGTAPDTVNIPRALALVDKAVAAGLIRHEMAQDVQQLIRATEWPHVQGEPGVAEAIIRDADMMSLASPCWFEHVFVGLRQEMEHRMGPLTLAEFCDVSQNFVDQLVLHSQWGKDQEKAYRATAQARQATARAACELTRKLELDALAAFAAVTGIAAQDMAC